MTDGRRKTYLKLALRVVGAFSIVALYPLSVFWPSGWVWDGGQSEYLQMIIAIYATLGVFLIIAARDPDQHVALVSFAIWSSVVHGTLMAFQSVLEPRHMGHLFGDVLALLLVALLLGYLSPRALRLPFARRAAPGPAVPGGPPSTPAG